MWLANSAVQLGLDQIGSALDLFYVFMWTENLPMLWLCACVESNLVYSRQVIKLEDDKEDKLAPVAGKGAEQSKDRAGIISTYIQ